MSTFGGIILTNRGKNLQSKAQIGVSLEFTRVGVGDGNLGSTSILELNALINQVKSLNINKLKTIGQGKAVLGTILSNQEMIEGFYFRELGVFALDPDIGEILYCYGNAGALAEYISAGGGPDVIEKNIDIQTIIGNAQNITAVIDESLVFYSKGEVLTVDQTKIPSSPGNGKITELFNWVGNRLKIITGKANWWESPVKSLQEIWDSHVAHKADKMQHIGTGCSVTHNTNQSIPVGVSSLSFNSEYFDTDNMHDSIINNSRLTCKVNGKYLITANLLFATNALGTRGLNIRKNGDRIVGAISTNALQYDPTPVNITTVCELVENDYIELLVGQNTSNPIDIIAASSSPVLTMIKVG